MAEFSIAGQIVEVSAGRIYAGTLHVANGHIAAIHETPGVTGLPYLLPGFVDAHVHIESSMMVPSEFARYAVTHGTVATVSDPHEIANVLGTAGVEFMVANGRQAPVKFHFGAPACVPATGFETAGATLDAAAVTDLFDRLGLRYLAEVMNFPGVLAGDADMLAKLAAARQRGLPIDGHAPGLRGERAARYAAAGPSTDHECVLLDEARDKILAGMNIMLREGSAAKNFAALHPLLTSDPTRCLFCADDLHPDALVQGHTNRLVQRAIGAGHELFNVLRAATLNPVRHYGLPVGLLRPGDPADVLVVENLVDFPIRQTYIDGQLVAEQGATRLARVPVAAPNRFGATRLHERQFAVPDRGTLVRVIETYDGQLITGELHLRPRVVGPNLVADVANDVLKLAVVNRYAPAEPAVGFVRGFGLRQGALAASVAHDSHNLIGVGTSDAELCRAFNALVETHGGLAVVDGTRVEVLPLEVAGLMSRDGAAVAAGYALVDQLARRLGSPLTAPFMTLSFLALLVIPALKLSDRGLFDGRTFAFTSLYV
jgi:adenine deaminase